MKIVRFIYDWPPPWMGLAPGPYEMSRTQVRSGHSLTVFCGGRRGKIPEPIPGARIIALPRAIKGILLFTSAPALLVRYLWHALSHPADVIHGHAHVTQWFHLWRLLFGGRTPYFFHLHITFLGRERALLEKGHRFNRYERFGNRAGAMSDAWGCKAASHIFTSNESVKAEAVALMGVPADKITVVKNGVNAALFRPGPKDPALLAGFGFTAEDRIVLYVGVINKRKNLGVLVDALALLPAPFKLLLAGDGPAEHIQELKDRSQALGVDGRVRFAGYLAYPDLPPYYSLCDVFALPSLYEGMPKVLLESLASGKPSIVHCDYGLDADLERFVDKADCTRPQALADCIQIAALRGFKGELDAFLAAFSWHAIMARVEEVYARYLLPRG